MSYKETAVGALTHITETPHITGSHWGATSAAGAPGLTHWISSCRTYYFHLNRHGVNLPCSNYEQGRDWINHPRRINAIKCKGWGSPLTDIILKGFLEGFFSPSECKFAGEKYFFNACQCGETTNYNSLNECGRVKPTPPWFQHCDFS